MCCFPGPAASASSFHAGQMASDGNRHMQIRVRSIFTCVKWTATAIQGKFHACIAPRTTENPADGQGGSALSQRIPNCRKKLPAMAARPSH